MAPALVLAPDSLVPALLALALVRLAPAWGLPAATSLARPLHPMP